MSRGARAARGAAVAAFATLVASLAHTIGGGDLPGPVAVLLALAFSTPLAVLLTGARMRLLRTSAAALVAQAALHLLYAAGGGPTIAPADGGPTGHPGHAASVVELSSAAPLVDHGHAASMPLAHVVAAALTVVFLAVADRALATIAAAFGTAVRGIRLLVAVLGGLPVALRPGVRSPTVERVIAPNAEALLLSSLRHRGPPVASSAA